MKSNKSKKPAAEKNERCKAFLSLLLAKWLKAAGKSMAFALKALPPKSGLVYLAAEPSR